MHRGHFQQRATESAEMFAACLMASAALNTMGIPGGGELAKTTGIGDVRTPLGIPGTWLGLGLAPLTF